jgi:hypothetical protein
VLCLLAGRANKKLRYEFTHTIENRQEVSNPRYMPARHAFALASAGGVACFPARPCLAILESYGINCS